MLDTGVVFYTKVLVNDVLVGIDHGGECQISYTAVLKLFLTTIDIEVIGWM